MKIVIKRTKEASGKEAAVLGAKLISDAIRRKGSASIIIGTGSSQSDMLNHLIHLPVYWRLVHCFHLDEFIGVSSRHKASVSRCLKERFADRVLPGSFHFINGEAYPEKECQRLNDIISQHQVDVAFVSIGENTHLAFNDPPADFETTYPYIIVNLDHLHRLRQVGEGRYRSLADVPQQAISMSVRQIMKATNIICMAPDERKAKAVQLTLHADITPDVPASILREHPAVTLFLDHQSASLLSQENVYNQEKV